MANIIYPTNCINQFNVDKSQKIIITSYYRYRLDVLELLMKEYYKNNIETKVLSTMLEINLLT